MGNHCLLFFLPENNIWGQCCDIWGNYGIYKQRIVTGNGHCVQHYQITKSWTYSFLKPSKMTYLPFPKQALVFTCLQYKSFENTVGKGEIARNEQFLLFPQCFLPFRKTCSHFHQSWNCRLLSLWVWKSLKCVVWERVKPLSDDKIGSICRRQMLLQHYISLHCGKKRKRLVSSIFSTCFNPFLYIYSL